MAEQPKEVASWPYPGKTGGELQLRRSRFSRGTYLDLRVFAPETPARPGPRPKAGISLTARMWAQILPALAAEVEKAERGEHVEN